ncbi:class I SAM-dependent methyltransferase [Mycolicibacterium frederiksbergense]|uniref:Class I SAM-dependent methyltransferase n=1 Tax=Mycolicibacterium frederiksbergense TaxID=117567 RepID=A0A6H0RYW2_9MYCO|nr:class I SAM-dependent methyltransferase [Mycolicibacterium frederiksbergense]QIV80472.1 class I SAM-dependent methyltransferase [Mycolicibacterium frederiksbergense]
MRERFDTAYETHTAPWVIGEPQPTVVALERTGLLRSPVLDIGCGLGEHTILLTRLGYDVVGIDFAPHAIAQARANATARGVDARFKIGDAFDLEAVAPYATVLDSALFHIFDDADRARYIESLRRVCRPAGYVHVLALSDAGRGFGPQVSEQVIRSAFAEGWDLEALETTTYRGVVGQAHADLLGLPAGTVVDEPAWLARVRRV